MTRRATEPPHDKSRIWDPYDGGRGVPAPTDADLVADFRAWVPTGRQRTVDQVVRLELKNTVGTRRKWVRRAAWVDLARWVRGQEVRESDDAGLRPVAAPG